MPDRKFLSTQEMRVIRVRYHIRPPFLLSDLYYATLSWFVARRFNGRFILTFDDRDGIEWAREVYSTLYWLGVNWDEGPNTVSSYAPYVTSQRGSIYRNVLDKLIENGTAYVDDEVGGITRFRLPDRVLSAEDAVRGMVTFQYAADPALDNADGTPTPLFEGVVDDITYGVSHAIYSENLLFDAPIRTALHAALDSDMPILVHTPPMHFPTLPARALYHMGYLPSAVRMTIAALALQSEPESLSEATDDLFDLFDVESLNITPRNFDMDLLNEYSQLYLSRVDTETVLEQARPYLQSAYPGEMRLMDDEWLNLLVDTVRNELITLWDVVPASRFVFDPLEPADLPPDAAPVLEMFRAALPEYGDIPPDVAEDLLRDVRKTFRAEYPENPIGTDATVRAALTGRSDGPDLAKIIALLAAQDCSQRIEHALETLN
jgi:nondiscriminating glutamyl-tRNA synthetase